MESLCRTGEPFLKLFLYACLKMDGDKSSKSWFTSTRNCHKMAQKWHFFKLSTIFSHDHWWDIGKIYFSTYTRAGQFNFFSGGGFRVVSRHIDEHFYYKTMGLYFNPRGAPYDQRFSFSQETKKYEIYENPKIWKQKWADLEQKYF